ncbi:MAG: hypothetical protein BRD55_11500 [Bacteroidetes bacterium SW_9_63_38]|nr:MAG: hypothetical protein BRD55_11500 [Bacteroidetes bacterium SW_9_63_38]
MCLLVFGYDAHSEYSLVFAGNRDEFYDRPTAPAGLWPEAPHVLGGRDRKAGGTWVGVTRAGYWGVVTNVREPGRYREDARSRGRLVDTYLREEPSPRTYLEQVAVEADTYNGFNLLLGTPTDLYYYSNRTTGIQTVAPGIHGLSNEQLDTPWPKVTRAKQRYQACLQQRDLSAEALLRLLNDRRPAPNAALPDTGLSRERERMLSSLFIDGERYGTRASTVLRIARDGTVAFTERTFEDGAPLETRRFSFDAG